MALPKPELLELFLLTCEQGSIAAAARALNISPSLATRKIAQLEQSLNTRLLQRTTRSMQVTESGKVVLRWARQSMAINDQLLDDLAEVQTQPTGTLRLVTSHYAGSEILPGILSRFLEQFPRIRLSITTTDKLVDLIKEGFDLAFHSGRIPDSSLIAYQIRPIERWLCATSAYLDKHGIPKDPQDLTNHCCLTHSVNEPRTWCFSRDKQLIAQNIDPIFEADDYAVILGLAKHSAGICRLAKDLVDQECASGTLVRLLPSFECVYPTGERPGLYVVYPNRRVPYRTRLLIDFLTHS